ncbi:bifunctional diguanylate cyclase/phosphodiesterase [Hahella ganghwensis]|uniref:bifunctional diguanylate cyclase/phosphodiesterase n=1 Tax=Hahella ganghwensis TaxID=286420 RepID=UPI0003A57D43|nr:EAL domain-containing protein [Hahella ganghwensis]
MFGRFVSKSNLRLKIFLVVLPLITLPLIAIGSMSYLYMRENSLRILENQMELALRSLSSELSKELATARANLDLFATNEVIGRYLALPETTRYRVMQPAVLSILSDYRRAFPQYTEIGIYLPDGRADTLVVDEFASPSDKEDFHKRLISESPKFMDKLYFDNSSGGFIDYVIAQRILAPEDETPGTGTGISRYKGYLVLVLRIPNINNRLASTLDLPEGLVALTSSTGDPYFSTLVLDDKMRSLVNQVVNSGIGRLRSINIDQEYYLGGFYRVTDQLLAVGVITQEVISRVVSPIVWGIAWSIVGVCIVAFLLIYSTLNGMLVTPLMRLKNQLLDFRAGREMILTDHRQDEFGELYTLVNDLAESQRLVRTRIKEMTYFDPLTGLPNRQAFTQILDKAVGLASRQDQVFGVLYIDMNGFKDINLKYGNAIGDELVKEASTRIQSCLRLSDDISRQVMSEDGVTDQVLVRTGGDEFSVLLRDIKKAHQASVVASRIVEQFQKAFDVKGISLSINVSIGISIYPLDGQSPDLLMKSADLAMYDAKQLSGNRYRFFTHALNASSEKRLVIEKALRRAINSDQFEVYLQPKVSLGTGVATEFEAVLRWNHPEHGIMSQEQFFSVAEETGQRADLDSLSVDLMCQACKEINERFAEPVRVSFNVSLKQLCSGKLVQQIDNCLDKHEINGQLLELEISETVVREFPEESSLLDIFKEFQSRGIKVTLDDFGREEVSLTMLRKYPFDRMKIASTMVREIEYDSRNERITESTMKLAHSLGIEVVVMGIEKSTSIIMMKRFGGDYVQGGYLQSAVAPEQLRADFRTDIFNTTPPIMTTDL